MKAFLMHKDQDLDLMQQLPSNEETLIQDLELNTLLNAMALGDNFLLNVAKHVVLSGMTDPDSIRYRQNILKDCLKNPAIVRDIYQIPIDSNEYKQKRWMGIYTRYPSGVLNSSLEMMQMFVGLLRELKNIADEKADQFESEGFTAFFAMIKKELDEEYLANVENHISELKFRDGVLISAELGKGNEGADYVLRKKQHGSNRRWVQNLFSNINPAYTFYISDRDEHGARALSELQDRGINLVANALAQSAEHINSFFTMLRDELAFYIGCLNLSEQLVQKGNPLAFPQPVAAGQRRLTFLGLYDACLALTNAQKIVGNDGDADNKDLLIITGANQGGKTTFMRSMGLAQLMMQCGMYVPAESFCANVCEGLFTHYKRKEDASMKSGKLDEELSRMSEIIDKITPNSIVLFNESFAATNEREGSEIAKQIVCALMEKHIKVFFVTHLYEFSNGFYSQGMKNVHFLRAERKEDGSRTFKLIEGEPMQTSYGEDVYNAVFGADEQHDGLGL